MLLHVPRILAVLLATLLSATFGTANSLDARSPQDSVDGISTPLHFYTPTPLYTIPSWYTRTSSASEPTASVSFAFGDVPDMSVCGRSNITWTMGGDTLYMIGIAAMPVSSDDSPTIITITGGGLGIGYYTWSPINVASGEYVLEVSVPNAGVLYYSETFYVFDSSDHSCLTSTSSSVTTNASSAPGTTTATSEANSSSSSADNASDIPVIGAVNNGPALSSGGIAGVVIGGVIFVGALIAVLILLRRCRSNRAVGAPRGGLFEKRRPKGAISIGSRGGSFSSTHGLPAQGRGNSAFVMAPHYSLNNPSRSDFGHGISDEDVGRSPSITGEKPLDHAPVELDITPPAVVHRSPHVYHDSFGSIASGSTTVGSPVSATNRYRPSNYASQLYMSDPFGSVPPTPSPRASGDYQDPSQVPVALFYPSSATSTPRAFGSPGVPRDISIASSSSPDLTYEPEVASPSAVFTAPTIPRRAPPSPPAVAPAFSQSGGRRTKSASARKPVPVYEPSISGEALELVEPSTPHYAASASASASASYYNNSADQHSRGSFGQSSLTGNDWSSGAVHSHSPVSGSSGSYLSQGSRHSLPGFAGRGDMPELNHKSSFGDRQMHVLMPDPPPREMQ